MKTAVSLSDTLFHEAERFARKLKKTRSQVYREALTEYLARHDPDEITEEINQICDNIETHPDPAFNTPTQRILKQSEW